MADGPGRSGGRAGELYAALDLGTNNCRLLVAAPAPSGFRVVDSFSRIIRLGEGMAATGRLADAAIERAMDALSICAAKLKRRSVRRVRAVATEACRRAANRAEFVVRVERDTGLRLEIISAQEEAELAVAGCGPLMDPMRSHAILFDIGGGSTEVAWVETRQGLRVIDMISLPIGVVDLAERHARSELTRLSYESIASEVAESLAAFEARNAILTQVADGAVQMIGTSGTVTTLAGIHMGLPRYDRSKVDGVHLAFDEAWRVADRLLSMTRAERTAHPCVLEGRADFVLPGTAILAGICKMWPVGRLRVADRGLREGILLRMMKVAAA